MGDITTICTLWRLALGDSRVFLFTDHDDVLTVEGMTYHPRQSLVETDADARLGLRHDGGAVRGLFDMPDLTAADVREGALDGARLSRLSYDWRNGGVPTLISVGRIGDVKVAGHGFEAEWLGLSSLLDRSTGRVFSRSCDASFCDSQCGLSRADFPADTRCARTYAACRDNFANTVNFRGFPYLLGDDALQAAPRDSDRMDGGSRYEHLR